MLGNPPEPKMPVCPTKCLGAFPLVEPPASLLACFDKISPQVLPSHCGPLSTSHKAAQATPPTSPWPHKSIPPHPNFGEHLSQPERLKFRPTRDSNSTTTVTPNPDFGSDIFASAQKKPSKNRQNGSRQRLELAPAQLRQGLPPLVGLHHPRSQPRRERR